MQTDLMRTLQWTRVTSDTMFFLAAVALDDVCTHTGDPLAGGELDGYTVTCPWHGAQFDIRSGKNLRMPALCPTRSHQVQVTNGEVFVKLRD